MTKEIEIGSSHGQVFVFTDGTISRFENDEGKAEFGIDGIGITKMDTNQHSPMKIGGTNHNI